MEQGFEIISIDGEQIVVNGIGKMFYEIGFPIQMSIDILKNKGYKVSILHIADELYKHGWDDKAILKAFTTDTGVDFEEIDLIKEFVKAGRDTHLSQDDRDPSKLKQGHVFIYSSGGYEAQHDMIFNYLFGYSVDSIREGKNSVPKSINDFLSNISPN